MSAAEQQADGLRQSVEAELNALSKADRTAVHAVAQKIRDAIAEGETQEPGLGMLGIALVSVEMQEQAS